MFLRNVSCLNLGLYSAMYQETELLIAKTRVFSYSRETHVYSYEYQLCHAAITRTSSIKDLGVFFDSKLYLHNNVDFLFFECIKLLGHVRSITYRFASLDCLYVLYFTSVRSTLEHASVVRNSITSTYANVLERIQQKFAPASFYFFVLHVPYNYIFTLQKLSVRYLCKRRHRFDVLFLLRSTVALNPAFTSWKMLVFLFLLAVLELLKV
jgi:hypothetical protein